MEFFREISIVSEPIPHSQSAAARDRQQVYAAHNANGKAQIWFTFCPDDTQSLQIAWYALGPDFAEKYRAKAPTGAMRFEIVSKYPGAAALHFEHVLDLVITHIIGWDVKSGKPFKRGGIFGIPKAFVRVVEEQNRLTLHSHFLIWIYGHHDIKGQFQRASLAMNNTMDSEILFPRTDCSEVMSFEYLRELI